MTHYSNNPGMVRVDYFKPGGKWYMTQEVDMTGFYNVTLPYDAVELALRGSDLWKPYFTMVVLEPYHYAAYPIMFPAKDSE